MAPVAQSNQVDKRACGYGGSIPTGGTENIYNGLHHVCRG